MSQFWEQRLRLNLQYNILRHFFSSFQKVDESINFGYQCIIDQSNQEICRALSTELMLNKSSKKEWDALLQFCVRKSTISLRNFCEAWTPGNWYQWPNNYPWWKYPKHLKKMPSFNFVWARLRKFFEAWTWEFLVSRLRVDTSRSPIIIFIFFIISLLVSHFLYHFLTSLPFPSSFYFL